MLPVSRPNEIYNQVLIVRKADYATMVLRVSERLAQSDYLLIALDSPEIRIGFIALFREH